MVNGYGIVGRCQWRQIAGPNPGFKGRFDQPCDGAESDLAGDERGDRHLIGGVEYGGGTATGTQGLIGETQAGEPIEIRRLEGELTNPGQVELGRGRTDSVG